MIRMNHEDVVDRNRLLPDTGSRLLIAHWRWASKDSTAPDAECNRYFLLRGMKQIRQLPAAEVFLESRHQVDRPLFAFFVLSNFRLLRDSPFDSLALNSKRITKVRNCENTKNAGQSHTGQDRWAANLGQVESRGPLPLRRQ